MSKIGNFIKNISPFNNRTEMPKILYVIKVILIFWVCKFGSELVGEVLVLAVHFACGKNPLEGELFDDKTITLMTYFGYAVIIGAIFLFWKLFQKKSLKELGFTGKPVIYLAGGILGAVLVVICAVASPSRERSDSTAYSEISILRWLRQCSYASCCRARWKKCSAGASCSSYL